MNPSPAPRLCLASASPRRSALLAQIGVPHRVVAAQIDESVHTGESPQAYVERLAAGKAAAIAAEPRSSHGLPVLGADTSVILGERIFGKPQSPDDAIEMLLALGGRTHEVLSAVALCDARGLHTRVSRTHVTMRPLAEREIRDYWASGEPRDKAGGYAIQGLAAVFIEHIDGSYSGVMGLPLFETAALLAEAGVPLWQPGATCGANAA
jgi:septum formation protein